ncbi:MAG: GH1 family beta-glucosidase [Chthonomonadales bacterium]
MSFPPEFFFGVATASYQIEGSAARAGGGLSVWDMFCRRPGKVWNGDTGEVACDHYNRWREDVAIMKEIGVQAYRFSVSWPRVIPQGVGCIHAEGLAFYDRLVDALLEASIEPWITLFHWDYPYELYCRGGWLNPDSPSWFAEYASVLARKLSDRVAHWITLNEPQCFIGLGHQLGTHAPGDQLGLAEVLRAAHHALLAHGRAVQVLRSECRKAPRVGIAPVGVTKHPASGDAPDVEAARQAMFRIVDTSPWNNTWWLDPIIRGAYPDDGLKLFGNAVPQIRSEDLDTICQPLDFLGVNIYNSQPIRAAADGAFDVVPYSVNTARTTYGWPVTPEALYWGPRFFWERYHLPIVITETGMGNTDWPAEDGMVHDPQRIDFLTRYLRHLHRASIEGVPVQGCFHWSLMDNFEWNEGYRMRFGLVYVNYDTQERILKDSARWYRELIQSRGEGSEV